jgi:hypothetical protein
MWSRSRTTNRHRLFCVYVARLSKSIRYHPDLCVLLGISNGEPPKSLAKKQGLSVRSPKVERRRRNPGARQESDISSWHTGNAHTHTHTHILNFVFPKKQRNLRKGKKVVSVYWRIFLFVKFRNQEKRETQHKKKTSERWKIHTVWWRTLCVCVRRWEKEERRQTNQYSIKESLLFYKLLTFTLAQRHLYMYIVEGRVVIIGQTRQELPFHFSHRNCI